VRIISTKKYVQSRRIAKVVAIAILKAQNRQKGGTVHYN
jgi:hypothetical protein